MIRILWSAKYHIHITNNGIFLEYKPLYNGQHLPTFEEYTTNHRGKKNILFFEAFPNYLCYLRMKAENVFIIPLLMEMRSNWISLAKISGNFSEK